MRLVNKHIVITRARHQAGNFADLLRAHGAIPIMYPCIAIIPTNDLASLDTALMHLASYDWLVITSANTVEMIQQRLADQHISADFGAIKIGALGIKTANAIRSALRHTVDFIPSHPSAQHLGFELPIRPSETILLPQSALAKPDLALTLSQRGGVVTAISAYQTIADTSDDDLPTLLAHQRVDAITFTSSSCVTHFVQRLGYVPDVPAVCIGDITAQTAQVAGFRRIFTTSDARLESFIDVLQRILK